MKTSCIRWGRSAYEREEDLLFEVDELAKLDVEMRLCPNQVEDFGDCEILVVHSKKQVTGEVMDRAPQLKLVLTTTSGHDHIDKVAASTRGITVARSPLARRDAVIDTTLGMALSLLRDLPYFHRESATGEWARAKLPQRPIRLVKDLTIGLVGYGVIGQQAEQVWASLGAHVLHTDPASSQSLPLPELASKCDILSLHCALNESTHRCINQDILRLMPDNAILLNTARGPCVDIDALLNTTHLGGVGLDVFPEEPYPRLAELANQPNYWVAPHAAGYHQDLGRAITTEVVATIRAWREHRPLPHEVRT